jgi:4'-phosphopantetheinyl transferase
LSGDAAADRDADAVDVWFASTAALERARPRFEAMLDAPERERVERFRFDDDRIAFALRRGWVRHVLAGYLGRQPEGLRFAVSEFGKPQLAGSDAAAGLRFNLSHSVDVAVLAVVPARRVGVDVERVRPGRDLEALATRFFSADEVTALRTLPESERQTAFYRCWTRKEAYLKARGEGLTLPLDRFSVPLAPGPGPALLGFVGDRREADRWAREDLDVEPGYVAALVVEGRLPRIRRRAVDIDALTRG